MCRGLFGPRHILCALLGRDARGTHSRDGNATIRSALDELEAAPGLLSPVLLPLFDSRVAGHIAAGSEGLAELFVHFDEGSRDAETNRAGLAGYSAALAGGLDIEPTVH